jgi:hypothetical protein
MNAARERTGQDKERGYFLEWLGVVTAMRQPTDDESAAILKKAGLTKTASWADWLLLLVNMAIKHGRWGKKICPSVNTNGEPFELGDATVRKRLTAAVEPGLLTKRPGLSAFHTATYDIKISGSEEQDAIDPIGSPSTPEVIPEPLSVTPTRVSAAWNPPWLVPNLHSSVLVTSPEPNANVPWPSQ